MMSRQKNGPPLNEQLVVRSVSVFPPEESECVTVIWCCLDLMEHTLDISIQCNLFFTKSHQHTNNRICQIRSSKKLIIQRCSLVFCSPLLCLSWFVQYQVMGKVPKQLVLYSDFVKWHSSCRTLGKILFHGGLVILKELAI